MKLLLLILMAAVSYGQALPMRFANLPTCAGATQFARPTANEQGNILLLRVQDPTGTAVEIWCAKEAAGYNQQYRIVAPDGRSRRLDRCELVDGVTSAGVEHEGPVAETKLPNGGQWLRTGGRILRFTHNNWDTLRGHHTVYDLKQQRLRTYETRLVEDPMGRWQEVLGDVGEVELAKVPQGEAAAALGKLPVERVFDANRVTCVTALGDEGRKLVEQEVAAFVEPGKAGMQTVAWPDSSPVEKVEFDAARRILKVKLRQGERKTRVSVAFPRTMLGLGREITLVRLDGRFVAANETSTATHKAVTFEVVEPASEAVLTESGGFPFFMVSGLALVGGLVIGTVVALLFRRKLPAVAED
jgi:hypothetical protein